MIFEVLEVLGEGLGTLSEMKAAKRALERCLRVPFCRFCEIFEILRVPLGGHLGSKFWTFFWFDFWSILGSLFGGAGGRGGPPLSLKNLKTWGTASVELARPSHPAGWGRILKAPPLPPAPLAISWLLICRSEGSAGFQRFAGLKALENWVIRNIFPSRLDSFFSAIVNWVQWVCVQIYWFFEVLVDHFSSISGSWGTTFTQSWWLLGARVHSDGTSSVPGWNFIDFPWI